MNTGLLDPTSHSGTCLGFPLLSYLAEDAGFLRRFLRFYMHRLLVASDIVMLVRFYALLMILRLLLHFLLGDNLLPAVHTGRLIKAVWEAECARFLILDDNAVLQSMVASAVAGVTAGVTHSY